MRLRISAPIVAVILVALAAPPAAMSVVARSEPKQPRLQMYVTTVGVTTYRDLVRAGYDIASVEEKASGIELALVLDRAERNGLRRRGLQLRVWRDARGRTQTRLAALQARDGFKVWRDYDGADGIAAELRRIASQHPDLAELHVLGRTHRGRDILAVRVTKNVANTRPGSKPGVLYQGTTHAREWISTEVTRRLLRWFVASADTSLIVQRVLERSELWFVPVVNPDGYQYSFRGDRLWRKNLRDNNGNGAVDSSDGVDLNRNYPRHWNYDDEGSTSAITSETYRGPGPASEPETQANMALFDMADLRFSISYHSFGRLLLYEQSWQSQTPSADDPVYVALSGTDRRPAIPDYNPGVGADLYTTNGDFGDWSHGDKGVLSWTVELATGCPGCGFVFPDEPELVRQEFARNLGFALRVARSAGDPDDPVSHFADTKGFYLDVSRLDPFKTNNPLTDLTFDVSYAGGSAQAVDVLAKRSLEDVTLRYRVDRGPVRSEPTRPVPDGEVFGGDDDYSVYYHYLRAEVPRLSAGEAVTYWFTAVDQRGNTVRSGRSTFRVVKNDEADVLVVAAEDRTGSANVPRYRRTKAANPNYLSFYTAALEANDIAFDVFDVDARGRRAPDHLGVLGHYDAVVWYTGNDRVTRRRNWGPGNVSRLANDVTLEMRQYLNEGGRVLYTGQWAGAVESGNAGAQFYDPVANERCVVGNTLLDRCQFISDKDDFLQYYLGAYLYKSDPRASRPLAIEGLGQPYRGERWGINGADGASNQVHTATLTTTSSILKPRQYPLFASDATAQWRGAGLPFEPLDGSWYVYSQRGDISFKRLGRAIDLRGVGAGANPMLEFNTSYDTEAAWDFLFVEAHTVGRDDWTTLRDLNGHTSRATGESCSAGWFAIHPRLRRYQGDNCGGNPPGRGEWHAASGRSRGWERWRLDLAGYAGRRVEVFVSYASDWSIQGLGAFIDKIVVTGAEGSTSFEEDAAPLDGWAAGRPPRSAPNPNNWARTESVGFEEAPVVATDDSLYLAFGFEGISGARARANVMRLSIEYLLE
jgi:hypothetical protein